MNRNKPGIKKITRGEYRKMNLRCLQPSLRECNFDIPTRSLYGTGISEIDKFALAHLIIISEANSIPRVLSESLSRLSCLIARTPQ